MKPPAFDYAAPTQVAEVIDLLTAHADADPRVIAGGQSLVPLMNFRLAQPGILIDLQHVSGLSDIRLTDDELVIGAMVRQSAAEESADVRAAAPLLVEALGYVAHLPIRNSGTIGGSIAHADPSAELPAAVLALDATMTTAGPAGNVGSRPPSSSRARSPPPSNPTRSSPSCGSSAARARTLSSSSPARTAASPSSRSRSTLRLMTSGPSPGRPSR
jgi:carbon-monoxide dehydrogenase medium subunit